MLPVKVVADIKTKLEWINTAVHYGSFDRPELTYMVKQTENKMGYLITVASNLRESGIIYANTRRETEKIAKTLGFKKYLGRSISCRYGQ